MRRNTDRSGPSPATNDFFISYNHHDQAWAEWIGWQLEDAGYRVVLQAWDFLAGTNFVAAMDEGLTRAARVIAVLSQNYLDSRFCKPEWSHAFSQDPTGKARRLIPIRVQDCNVDGLLASIVYVDLLGKDETAARQSILEHVTLSRAKPSAQPKFPAAVIRKPTFPHTPQLTPGDVAPPVPADLELSSTAKASATKLMLVLSGTIDEVNKPLAEAIEAHLRKISGDATLTLVRIDPGSILLTIEGTEGGLARLQHLFSIGQLDSLGPFRILSVHRQLEEASQGVERTADDGPETGEAAELLAAEELINCARRGDAACMNELIALIYPELKRRAAWLMAGEQRGYRFDRSGADLVQIVMEKLVASDQHLWDVVQNEEDLIRRLTRNMRYVLVDYARAGARMKSPPRVPAEFKESFRLVDPVNIEEIIGTHEALDVLAKEDPDAARAVELRFFAALTNEEAAAAMSLSVAGFRRALKRATVSLRTIMGTSADLSE